MQNYIKSKLPPLLKRPIRKLFDRVQKLFDRARGLTTTPFTPEEIAALVEKADPTILEIGCNDGSHTLAFLRVMPQAKIYCFEPDPRAIACFKKNFGSPPEQQSETI